MVEAVGHLESALTVLEDLPEHHDRDEQEWEIHMLLGPATLATKGHAYPPLEKTYNRALELCVKLDKPVDRIKVTRGLQVFHMVSGRLQQALILAEQIAALVEELDDPAFRVAAAQVLGQVHGFLGNFSTALSALETGIALYEPEHHQIPNWPGGNSGEQCHLNAAFIHWFQGRTRKAFEYCESAVDFANRQSTGFSLANTLAFVTFIWALHRDRAKTRVLAEEGVALCEEQSNAHYLHYNRVIRGWARLETDEPADCVSEIQESIQAFRQTGARVNVPYFFALQAEGLAKMGKADEAIGLIDEALSTS